MTRTNQSARLARKVAERWLKRGLTEHDFYMIVLEREHDRIRPSDRTLWRQVEYALDHLSPTDLNRMADDLLRASR